MNNAKMTPRQKMINMLYLVLTAILALNVSSEVLDAFKNVNDGISVSNSSLQTKTASLYSQMDFQYQNDPVKAKIAYENSKKAREVSSKLFNLLEQYKKEIIAKAGGIDTETGKIKRDDDVNVATLMFVEDGGKKGKELKAQIESTRAELLKLVPEQERAGVDKSLALKIDEPAAGNTWEYASFNHVPVVAAVTLLNKYQNDLLGAENHVVENLYKSINDGRIVVDQMEAKIISPSSLIMQGEAYKADVMVAAYSSTQHPDVFLGSFNSQIKKGDNGTYQMVESTSDVPPLTNARQVDVDGGFGKLAMDGSTTGVKKYTGVVRVKKDNKFQFYPFEGEYQVAPKLAVVSPKMMNVVYIGLENPVDVSVAGVAQADVIATVEGNGTLVKNGGSYNMLVTTPGTTKVKVSAKVNGKVMPMGEQVFRVKSIPNPATSIDGISFGGNANGEFIRQRNGIVPKQDDFIYGGIPWKVQTFTVSVLKSGQVFKVDNVGPVFNAKAKELMKGLKKGDGFFVDDVMVKGPDNKLRKLAPLGYNITGQ